MDPPVGSGEASPAAPHRRTRRSSSAGGSRSPPSGAATKRHRSPRGRKNRRSPAAHSAKRTSPLKSRPRSFTPSKRNAVTRVRLLILRYRGRDAGFFRLPSAPTARGSQSVMLRVRSAAHHELLRQSRTGPLSDRRARHRLPAPGPASSRSQPHRSGTRRAARYRGTPRTRCLSSSLKSSAVTDAG